MKRYYCNICDYKSYYGQHVESHQKHNHQGEEMKVLKLGCSFCEQNTEHDKHQGTGSQESLKCDGWLGPITINFSTTMSLNFNFFKMPSQMSFAHENFESSLCPHEVKFSTFHGIADVN